MIQPLDPNDPNYQQKLIDALKGGTAVAGGPPPAPRWNGGPLDPITGLPVGTGPPVTGLPGTTLPGAAGEAAKTTTGSTTEPTKTELPGATTPPASSGYDATGLDPNNAIDATFIKNQYKQGGAGSGFGDLAYWRAHPDQAARLSADQLGKGTDMPGPGDVGNTSFDPNAGRGGVGSSGSGLSNPLSMFPGTSLPALSGQDPADSILARIMAALSQYGGG